MASDWQPNLGSLAQTSACTTLVLLGSIWTPQETSIDPKHCSHKKKKKKKKKRKKKKMVFMSIYRE